MYMKIVDTPNVFKKLQEWGNVALEEMYATFNMGIGMILIVDKDVAKEIISEYERLDQVIYNLGTIQRGDLCVEI